MVFVFPFGSELGHDVFEIFFVVDEVICEILVGGNLFVLDRLPELPAQANVKDLILEFESHPSERVLLDLPHFSEHKVQLLLV